MTSTCWRSECRTACYYPDACSEASGRKDSEGWASYAAEQERHTETAQARDAHYEARNKLAAKVDHLEARLAEMAREARLSREATEKAVRREMRLRERIAYLAKVYAVAPGEPRCCSDCAANDISDELREVLADA